MYGRVKRKTFQMPMRHMLGLAPFRSHASEANRARLFILRVEGGMNLKTYEFIHIAHFPHCRPHAVHPQTDATPRALQLLKSLSSLQFEQESHSVRMYSDFHSIPYISQLFLTLTLLFRKQLILTSSQAQ